MYTGELSPERMHAIAPRALQLLIFFTSMKTSAYEARLWIEQALVRGGYATAIEMEQFDAAVRVMALDFLNKKMERALQEGVVPAPVLDPSREFTCRVSLVVLLAYRVEQLLGAEEVYYPLWREVGAEHGIALHDMQRTDYAFRVVVSEWFQKYKVPLVF